MAGRTYHHGNLRAALIAATLDIAAESGVQAVSVREAARRAGVSPGAPFHHFPNRRALLGAVAEQAITRLAQAVEVALSAAESAPVIEQFRAYGRAYLTWARDHKTEFLIVSNRSLYDFAATPGIVAANDALQRRLTALIAAAAPAITGPTAALTLRAASYGLARMIVDGHLPQWGVAEADAVPVGMAALDLVLAGVLGQAVAASSG